MRKYTINYTDLVFNALLDVLKRTNRRTIDEKDISDFEKILSEISRINNIDLDIRYPSSYDDYKNIIAHYAYMYENNILNVTYTLYPWINREELEEKIRYSIFVSMEPVYGVTRERLKSSRTIDEQTQLNEISTIVNNQCLGTTKPPISKLDIKKKNRKNKIS